ncbi:MAG: ABC transporter substrate-binding protein [Chitinophagales bacterium]|nr:ABC transporter substrate-binding protein [Chitinophagales bacterium]
MRQIFLIFILGLLVLSSCRNDENQSDKKIFRMNMSAGLSSLDPAFSKDQSTMWMCNQLYDGLLQLDSQLNILPSIAKSYSVSEDGLTYIFTLRDDVYFHQNEFFKNGKTRQVVADDFVYSFGRLLDSKVASPGAWLFNGKVRDSLPFEAVNDTTFVLHLKVAFRPMLSLLTLPYCSVVPHEIVEHYGKDFRTVAIGTGPFKLKKWQEQATLILEKNEQYFERDKQGNALPYIDGVRVDFLTDRSVEFLQFLQGNLDMVSGIDRSFRDKALSYRGGLLDELKGKVTLQRKPYMNTEYLGFSMKKLHNEALRDVKVRKAINYAIDRKKMLVYLRNGIGIPAQYGIIPEGVKGFNPSVKGYYYDLGLARQLLKEAGYPNGKGVGVIVLNSNPIYQDLTEYIAKSLSEIGLQIEVQLNPGSFLRESMAKNRVDFFRASWIGDYPDAENFLALFYGGNSAPPNYTFFRNEKYDEIYRKAIVAKSDEDAGRLYTQLEQIMLDNAPIVPLFYDELIRFLGKRVKSLPTNSMNMLMLKTAQLD